MGEFTTEAEVRNIVTEMLKDERAERDKQHEQNSMKFDQLFAGLNQIKGGGAVLGLILVVLQVIRMVTNK
jgi:hypothetical protein